MFVRKGYLHFKIGKDVYRIIPGDIIMEAGQCAFFFCNKRAIDRSKSPLVPEVPKREWKILRSYLAPVPLGEFKMENPILKRIVEQPSDDVRFFFEFL